jgi:DNA-binding transcriptional LysR family regulator
VAETDEHLAQALAEAAGGTARKASPPLGVAAGLGQAFPHQEQDEVLVPVHGVSSFGPEHRAPWTISKINCRDGDHQLPFDVMDLQLGPLRTLQAVARHGSFSRAAAELGLTQPAVSMQVRQLEHQVGLPLLERVGKRAFPTRAGEVLIAHAARAFLELEAGVERVQQLRGIVAGRVRLGTSASISIYLLPPLFRRFRARYPETQLQVVTGNASEIVRAIVGNELDLGIVSLPVRSRELAVAPFYRDDLVAIVPPRRPWSGRVARPADLTREPLILFERGATLRRVIDQWFHRAGVTPERVMEMGNTEAIKKLVHAGLGCSVTSWFSARAEARTGELRAIRLDPPVNRQIGAVYRRDKTRTPSLEAFLGAVEELRAQLDRESSARRRA